jgi:2-(1,2-epoxy-1,2-dihydrophenyl)acetyl-CoA isomerase
MHDPATRNALGPDMAQEVMDALDSFEGSRDQRVVLFTGTEPSFCSGANVRGFNRTIQERDQRSPEDGAAPALPWGTMEARLARRSEKIPFAGQASRIPLRIHQLQKPSIAAVNGHAMGVGLGLGVALGCDIRIAAEKAVFSEAFVRMGLIPGDGSSWQLPRLIGLSNTLLLQYTEDRIDGNEAYRMGLVSKVVAHEALMEAAMELAVRIAQGPPQALSLIKYLAHRSLDSSMEESLEIAHVAQEQARSTEDHKEAVQAFLEKRQPKFRGR